MDNERTSSRLSTAILAPSRSMRAKFLREVAGAGLGSDPGPREPVTEAELAALPATAQRYLRFMKVVGRPRVWSFRARWTGVFRRRPDQPWTACEAWQYDTRLGIARIFHMRLRFGLLPLLVRDTYVRGKGRMLGRMLDTFSVVDEANFKIDTGELVTYLNDAILFAPSMVLGPEATWTAVDDRSFDVALTDHERTVTARVFVDERGAVTDFSTTDRYGNDPAHPRDMVQARWSTPVAGWMVVDGRPVARGGTAVWHFASGDFAYAAFSLADGDIEFDVAPASPGDVAPASPGAAAPKRATA
ncbi:DUF6544 family protein [Sorangium sp. So ce260]|uniref:DUF6544 family protein n=1 Tax=Sorangium sp. So ce260 TaxID=3133291 RepID=UPI003F5FD3B8